MFKSFFNKGSFASNILTLVSGTLIAQALPLAVSPILTRLFNPDDFGLFGLYMGVVVILSVPVTGRYELAVMLPKDDDDAINVMSLSLVCTVVISFLILLVSFVLHDQILDFFDNKAIGTWLYIVSVSTFFVGVYQSLNYWFNRKSKYRELATSRVVRSANTSGFSILFGALKLNGGGLILGDLIGQAVASIYLIVRFFKSHKSKLSVVSWQRMKKMARRYNQFPKFNVVSGVLEKGSGQMPVLLLTSFFNLTVVGLFSFAQRIISAPSAIIARAFGDVFRQRASEQYLKTGECKALFNALAKRLFLMGIIPFSVLFFIAPAAFGFIFGSKWYVAGEYTQIMTVMFFLQFVVSPLSVMFLVAEKQKLDLFLQFYLFCSLFISFFVGYKVYNDPKMCLLFFTVAYSIKYLIEFALAYRFSAGK